jgi:hypothetical protein
LKRRQSTLIAGTLALWALLYFPARLLSGPEGAIYSLVAALLCLIPTSLTLAWASRPQARTADQQLRLVMGGTGLRMIFVLGVGIELYLALPYFQQLSFWAWLLVFYLFTLGLETVLLRERSMARE